MGVLGVGKPGARKTRYTTVSIPVTLYERIRRLIEGTGFTSVSQFVTYVLREVVARMEEEKLRSEGISEEEKREIIERLKRLGYL
jgi:Arc/MetJ-type ribon-helix-helix transcriptional regulator